MDKIKTSSVNNYFGDHLEREYNERIIFTGQFGSGKTYFLKDFFEKRKEQYNTFWLSPIKYSVASNEDIIEYIKLDIAMMLVRDFLEPSGVVTIPDGLMIHSYMTNNLGIFTEIFLKGVAGLAEVPKAIVSTMDSLKKQHTQYKNYKKEIHEKLKTDDKLLLEYINTNTTRIGSIFEDDIITQTIRASIAFINEPRAEEDQKKESVLVIDDLDRLDPDHIFRLLNIFSLHHDNYLFGFHKNKFGFDKIILVCDIDSIEKFYYHKYGSEANFQGYIDKFCSTKYFRFSINDYVENFCKNQMSVNELDEASSVVLSKIFEVLIREKKITIRNLVKYSYTRPQKETYFDYSFDFDEQRYSYNHLFIRSEKIHIGSQNFPFIRAIVILLEVVGGFKNFSAIIEDLLTNKVAFSKDVGKATMDSLCLLYHLAKNYPKVNRLCFDYQEVWSGDWVGNAKMKYPTINIFGISVTLHLRWDRRKKYTGSLDYYEGTMLEIQESYVVSEQGIFNVMKEIMAFLEKEKIL
ncbi:MAG: P-loop NTPase fold protein [Aureispira sp.]